MILDPDQIRQFKSEGYLVIRACLGGAEVDHLLAVTARHLDQRITPFELEASLPYPNAPLSESSPGGQTIRRLLQAWDRDPVFRQWAADPGLIRMLGQLLETDTVHLSRCHHNCIMTKRPDYSSDTLWHRDTRYWSFSGHELINAWLALVPERQNNGGLRVIPKSCHLDLTDEQLDVALFLRTDLAANQALIEQSIAIDLDPGDLLLFHARTLHAASRNLTDQTKYSVVTSYHSDRIVPVAGSNSDRLSEIIFKRTTDQQPPAT